jgi:hypothetical protein
MHNIITKAENNAFIIVKFLVCELELFQTIAQKNSNGAGRQTLQKEVCYTCGKMLFSWLIDTDSGESGLRSCC